MNMTIKNEEAVDIRHLSSNIGTIVNDCCGNDLTPHSPIEKQFELLSWLANTSLTQEMKNGLSTCNTYKDSDGWKLKVPATIYSLPATDTTGECCFAPFDFAKCSGEIPLKRICLKDCKTLDDMMMEDEVTLSNGVKNLLSKGMTLEQAKDKINRLSFAFFAESTIIRGVHDVETLTTKPFHGLLEVMENPAVISIDASRGILMAFESLRCRLRYLKGGDNYVLACNDLTLESIKARIEKDIFGEYPKGWNIDSNGNLTFEGFRFVTSKHFPVDLVGNLGEIWILSSQAVGMWLKTDILNPIVIGDFNEKPITDGCGSKCTFYLTHGGVVNNNADKIAKIINIPLNDACIAGIQGITDRVVPTTIIP